MRWGWVCGNGRVEIERDFDKALKQAQVVMMLRIQRERLAGLELDLGGLYCAVSVE